MMIKVASFAILLLAAYMVMDLPQNDLDGWTLEFMHAHAQSDDLAQLTVFAFSDANANGVMDVGEGPFPGVDILTFTLSTEILETITTGDDGTAQIMFVPDDFYAVALSSPEYEITAPTFEFEGNTHVGVTRIAEPVAGSSYVMNVGVVSNDMIVYTDPVKIGLLLPFTGSNAHLGEENKVAAEFAVSNFNKRMTQIGNGLSLEIVTADTGSTPTVALDGIKELHTQGVDIVVGPLSSASTTSIKQYADENDMLVLSCCSTAPALAIEDDSIFRMLPDDTNQGPVLTRLAFEEGIDVLVPIHIDDAWGNGLKDAVMDSYSGEGKIFATPIPYDPPTSDDVDYSDVVSQLADSVQNYVNTNTADRVAVLAIGFSELRDVMREASSHDILRDVLWIGADGIANDVNIISDSTVLEFAQTVNFVAVFPSTPITPITEVVLDHVATHVGYSPNPYVYSTYDATWVVGNSILEANSTSANDVKSVLHQVADRYIGARGDIMFNDAGDLVSVGYDILSIGDDAWENTGSYDTNTNEISGLLPSTVNVGTMFPLGIRDTAMQNLNGARLGIEDFNQYLVEKNAHWQIELVERDTRPDSSYTSSHSLDLITELHEQEGVRAIVGPQFSSNTGAIKEYVDTNEILVVSPSSTAVSLSIPDDSIYRLTTDDFNQSKAAAQLLTESDITTIVVAYRDDVWGQGLAGGISSEFEALGGNTHVTLSFSPQTADYTDLVEQLNNHALSALLSTSGEVAIMFIGFNEVVDVMRLASNMDNSNLDNLRWFGTDANHGSPALVDMETNPNVVGFASDVMFTAVQFTFQSNSISDDVKERIQIALDSTVEPNTYAYSSYEAAWLVGLAIEAAGNADSHAILDKFDEALEIRNTMPNIFSEIKLNKNGDLSGADYIISQIHAGHWMRVGTYLDSTQSIEFN